MFFTGLIIAFGTFLIIGVFHPIVIKTEYYFGTGPWWVFSLRVASSKAGVNHCCAFSVH